MSVAHHKSVALVLSAEQSQALDAILVDALEWYRQSCEEIRMCGPDTALALIASIDARVSAIADIRERMRPHARTA